jgi:hypothetical protein
MVITNDTGASACRSAEIVRHDAFAVVDTGAVTEPR